MQEWNMEASIKSKIYTLSSFHVVIRNDDAVIAVQLFCQKAFKDVSRTIEESFRLSVRRDIKAYREGKGLENLVSSDALNLFAQEWANKLPLDMVYEEDPNLAQTCVLYRSKAFQGIIALPNATLPRVKISEDEEMQRYLGYRKMKYVGIGVSSKLGSTDTVVVLNFCTSQTYGGI
mmetsp:Transcript_33250/g.76727  ORF Transcript_33250/g.76727 Transcript_33250/m.76727 type:complete len:176 (-) Transcript_33250:167-694(-)